MSKCRHPHHRVGPLVYWRSAGKTKLQEEGRCRMCERPSSMRPLTRHHLVPKSWFNQSARKHDPRYRYVKSCDANIIPLCRACHDAVEDDVTARRILRKMLGSQEVALVIYLQGSRWFDSKYPPNHRRPELELAAA